MATKSKLRYVQDTPAADESGEYPETVSDTPMPGQNRVIGAKTPSTAGAGRGKGYAAGGRVTGYKGYGKAKKV